MPASHTPTRNARDGIAEADRYDRTPGSGDRTNESNESDDSDDNGGDDGDGGNDSTRDGDGGNDGTRDGDDTSSKTIARRRQPSFDAVRSRDFADRDGVRDMQRPCRFGGFILDVSQCHNMVPNTAAASDPAGDGEVMVSVDGSGAAARVVIADISRDGAWVSFPLAEAAAITEWR